jgi:hypothetical protein
MQLHVAPQQEAAAAPTVRFYGMIPDAPQPVRADRSVGGTVPTRAFRYCEPLRTASAFGWYIFPPIDFSLYFDGVDTAWSLDGETWNNLDSIQYPGFSDLFNEHCPAVARDCAPPFLAVGAEPGIIAVWSGFIARTAPGWSLLIRPPANLPRSNRYDHYEGIVDTDRWTGPLFANIRLTKTDLPIEFKRETPYLQVQALPRQAYSDETVANFDVVTDLADFPANEWDGYVATVVAPGTGMNREPANYARSARRRTSSVGG